MKKKIIMLLIVGLTIATVCACGKKEEQENEASPSGNIQEEYSHETEWETVEASEAESLPEIESVTEQESEQENIQESAAETESTAEPESESETEKTSEGEEEPEVTTPPLYGAELEASEIEEDLKAVFDSALNFLVPEEELDAASKVSNAILNQTDITINSVENGICNVTVKYPNAAAALIAAEAMLAKDASREEVDEMFTTLAQSIESGEVEMIEKTLDVEIVETDGFRNIKWTKELYDAITGGLYSIE